jgi:hypothetical protein
VSLPIEQRRGNRFVIERSRDGAKVGRNREWNGGCCLRRTDPQARVEFEITIFGDETHVNYNRILLSSVLAGEKAAKDIVLNGLD